ncbi:hypothetical protein RND81_13G219400 [Saponaria officinalis]|uniref:rhamnogalacturonan endolyase n=1 Tax=Saponaria officinalis TaxID=3572 RepID=A0AAW1H121_SAPOF
MKVVCGRTTFIFVGRRRLLLVPLFLCFSAAASLMETASDDVTLLVRDNEVVIDNGILQLTIASPQGYLTRVSYAGLDNLLETRNKLSNRGYWDVVWGTHGHHSTTDWILGSEFKVIVNNEDQVEVSFTNVWDSTSWNTSGANARLPVNVDRRYIMLRGSSGFYVYVLLEREEGYPASDIYQIRTVYKLDQQRFHYMAISDDRQRIMPMPGDRQSGLPLAYKEAVILTNPTNPDLKGEVDDKYQYSCEHKDNNVHGWISVEPQVGFWIITPSNEFRSGGPMKQDLTSHVGPTTLAMFHSTHYAGLDVTMRFEEGEPWKKVFGPYYVYLNSVSEDIDLHTLWDDAKHQMEEEVRSWPYEFPLSEDFPKSMLRGFVFGRLLVHDRWKTPRPACSAWVGLAAPGDAGSWQTETKGYQFWTQADCDGRFMIKGIRDGVYNLYAWVPGVIGDYKYAENITIIPGSAMRLADLVFEPLRNGPTLWQIGIPDRTALEFYVPTPSRLFVNKLYIDNELNKFRQYGLWERYAELYPDEDLIYTVETSEYQRDWFFAQVTRKVDNDTYKPTTWQIRFNLNDVIPSANYTLRIALASASRSELQVRFNDGNLRMPQFSTMLIGSDNAIARHGIHGLYWLFNVDVPSEWLTVGNNTVYMEQTRHKGPFEGIMYDYIRLEGPSPHRQSAIAALREEYDFSLP